MIIDALVPLGLDTPTRRAIARSSERAREALDRTARRGRREIVHGLITRIDVDDEQILSHLDRASIPSVALPEGFLMPNRPAVTVEPLALSITASLRRAGRGVRLVIGGGAANAADSGLVSLLAKAIATRGTFFSAQDDSVEAMADRLGLRRDYLSVLLRLSYLSPEIVQTILAGQHPVELMPTRLSPCREICRMIGRSAVCNADAAMGSLSSYLTSMTQTPSH